MLAGGAPQKLPFAWARDAPVGDILPVSLTSLVGIIDGRASLPTGFVDLNFKPVAAGGVPPFGGDHNGIMNWISLIAQWFQAGGPMPYDAAFSAAIGGYPRGARCVSTRAGYPVIWQSLQDNNTNNPDVDPIGNGWVSFGQNAIFANANIALRTQQNGATIFCNNALVISLPTASVYAGLTYDIFNESGQTVTLQAAGGNIYGYGTGTNTVSLNSGSYHFRVWSDGGNWILTAFATVNSGNSLGVPANLTAGGTITGAYVSSSGDMYAAGSYTGGNVQVNNLIQGNYGRVNIGARGSGDGGRIVNMSDFTLGSFGTEEFTFVHPDGTIIQGSNGAIPAAGTSVPYAQLFTLPTRFPNNHLWSMATWAGTTPPDSGTIAGQPNDLGTIRVSINAPNGPQYGFGYIAIGN